MSKNHEFCITDDEFCIKNEELCRVTRRKNLFVGRHAFGVKGMETADSEELLRTLLGHACQPPRTYHHDWAEGDLVVWCVFVVFHTDGDVLVSLLFLIAALIAGIIAASCTARGRSTTGSRG